MWKQRALSMRTRRHGHAVPLSPDAHRHGTGRARGRRVLQQMDAHMLKPPHHSPRTIEEYIALLIAELSTQTETGTGTGS